MKKVKILGKSIPILVLVLLGVGMVSGALVTYLSNTATAEVTVESPMSIQFAKIGPVDTSGGFTNTASWTDNLVMVETTGLSTSELGVKVVNNADIAIEDKWLELKVSNNLNNVNCDDISSLMFWDTATQTQINKGYQNLSGLCSDPGNYVVYKIDINSLGADQTFRYPVKLIFGVVAPATYTFEAQMTV